MLRAIHARGLLAALLLASPTAAHDVTVGDITIDHPWARPNLPNRPTAAYATITNAGAEADRLIAATSPAFGAIELHTTKKVGDVMKMEQVTAIDAAAGETVTLAPGGLHIMLFDAAESFQEGDSFPLTLTFETAGEVEVTVKVEKTNPGTGDHSGHSGHGG